MTKEKAIARLKENPLDRERWIEAGKAMGWKESASENIDSNWYHIEEWKARWHGFVHTLTEGGTAEEFFKELE